MGVLLVSTEPADLVEACDRILVLHPGRPPREMRTEDADEVLDADLLHRPTGAPCPTPAATPCPDTDSEQPRPNQDRRRPEPPAVDRTRRPGLAAPRRRQLRADRGLGR